MKSEKRSHKRVKLNNVKADVFPAHSCEQETCLNAEILDISRSGIRIKLCEALDSNFHENVKISMCLPESGTPFTVQCSLKNQHSESEYGLHYTDHVDGSIDDMLFECIKLDDSMFLIKSA